MPRNRDREHPDDIGVELAPAVTPHQCACHQVITLRCFGDHGPEGDWRAVLDPEAGEACPECGEAGERCGYPQDPA
jgi:hypothetical protein